MPRKFGILVQQEGLACRCNSFSFTFLHDDDDVHWKLYSTRQGIDAEMGDDLKNKNLLLLSKIAEYFNPKRSSRPRPFADSTYLYNISDVYGGQENLPYWYNNLRSERFEGYKSYGLLFRPDINREISRAINSNFEADVAKGTIVTGPQNIGKSFTLVNQVIQWESTGEYLVTFIPDCETWDSSHDLVKAIFNSFGSNYKEFGYNPENLNGAVIEDIINEIDTILFSLGKKWIFVFDQINKISKKSPLAQGMVGDYPFPFKMIKACMKEGRITSIISASANNEASYTNNHEGFVEYIHKSYMSKREVEIAFAKSINKTGVSLDMITDLTGGVPGYVDQLLNKCNGNVVVFGEKIRIQVVLSLDKLEISSSLKKWKAVTETVVSSLLGLTTTVFEYYDRQLFTCENIDSEFYKYHALIPAISTYCKRYFYNELLYTVEKKEAELLTICRRNETPQSVKGFCFEQMVLNRFRSKKISFKLAQTGENFTIPASEARNYKILKNAFPPVIKENGIHIPESAMFPAVDAIFKTNNTKIGVQIHISQKDINDIYKFGNRSEAAGWFESNDKLYLMFLSPEKKLSDAMQKIILQNPIPNFSVFALDITFVEGLEDLMWLS
jgi:hypothetical protein